MMPQQLISVRTVDLTENIMRIKGWNIIIGWNLFTCVFPMVYFWLLDTVWCYSWSNTIFINYFLLWIFRSILYYLRKYGFQGSQIQYLSRAVWRCFTKLKKRYLLNCFEINSAHISEIYWFVLKNAKTDPWNKPWQLTVLPYIYRPLTNRQNFRISLFVYFSNSWTNSLKIPYP